MNNIARFAALALGVIWLTGCATQQARLGEPMKYPPEHKVSVKEVLAHPEKYDGKHIRVAGVVADLCDHAGCWMSLADDKGDEDALFVQFTYDLTKARIDPQSRGHKVVADGKLVVQEVPEGQRKHLAQEAGLSAEEVAKISGSEMRVTLECPSAVIKGVKPAPPGQCESEEG